MSQVRAVGNSIVGLQNFMDIAGVSGIVWPRLGSGSAGVPQDVTGVVSAIASIERLDGDQRPTLRSRATASELQSGPCVAISSPAAFPSSRC